MIKDTGEARQSNGPLKALYILEMGCFAAFVVISSYVLSQIFTGKADDLAVLAGIENLFNLGCVLIGLFYVACEGICARLDRRRSQQQ